MDKTNPFHNGLYDLNCILYMYPDVSEVEKCVYLRALSNYV